MFDGRQQHCCRPSNMLYGDRQTRGWRPPHNDLYCVKEECLQTKEGGCV